MNRTTTYVLLALAGLAAVAVLVLALRPRPKSFFDQINDFADSPLAAWLVAP